jgi:hypothetical protein
MSDKKNPLNATVDTGAVDLSLGAPTNEDLADLFADKEFVSMLKKSGLSDEEIAATVAELESVNAEND